MMMTLPMKSPKQTKLESLTKNNKKTGRRKRRNSITPEKFENLPPLKQKGSLRTLAMAMRWGCAIRNIGQKYTESLDHDMEVHKDYQGILAHYTGQGLDRFRKLVTMVCRMLKVINMFRQHARDTGRPVHVEELSHVERFTSQIPAHPLSFDPKLYSPKEFQYRMEPEARDILQLPWISRTEDQIRHVWLALRHLKEFRNMTTSMQLVMAKYARYEVHGKNRTIVRKGDPGRHYYFIYSGQVELRNSASIESSKDLPKIGPGGDFGHVALLHMERRTATVVCTEETEFIVLDRRGNRRAVYRALLREHKQKCTFLKTLEIFRGLDDESYRNLTDHGRIAEYLPMSLVATVARNHPFIYAIVQGVANVALTTDVYSCCIEDEDQRELIKRIDKRRNVCNHKSDKLHDVFTQHDPKLSLVIQNLKERHIFGMQHMLHLSEDLPTLHLIAKSKLTVLRIPVSSVQFFAKPVALHIATERYPMYPSVMDLIRRYMEDSVWDLYKAHLIRELKHFEGRVDPNKKCKYCISCQLRTLTVPSILPDPVRDEVTNLYCPGNSSPLPYIAKHTFRPRSAPPLVTPRNRPKPDFRSLNNSPSAKSPDFLQSLKNSSRNSVSCKNAKVRLEVTADVAGSDLKNTEIPSYAGSRRSMSRPKTAAVRRPASTSSGSDSNNGDGSSSETSRRPMSRPKTAAARRPPQTLSGRRSVIDRPESSAHERSESGEKICKIVSFASIRSTSSTTSQVRPSRRSIPVAV